MGVNVSFVVMKTSQTLAQARTPDGDAVTLHVHDGEFYLRKNGQNWLHTGATEFEANLAELGCERLSRMVRPRILVGGLGLGFVLKRVLEVVGPEAVVCVAEPVAELVAWQREFLLEVNGKLLDDPRVHILPKDIMRVLADAKSDKPESHYDAVLMETEQLPSFWMRADRVRVYKRAGYLRLTGALKSGGVAAFWAPGEDVDFAESFGRSGFRVRRHEVKTYPAAKRALYRVYVGTVVPGGTSHPSKADPAEPKRSPGREDSRGSHFNRARRLEFSKEPRNSSRA